MDEWINEWTNEYINEPTTNEWMNEWKNTTTNSTLWWLNIVARSCNSSQAKRLILEVLHAGPLT
jgi:hypothetical protein